MNQAELTERVTTLALKRWSEKRAAAVKACGETETLARHGTLEKAVESWSRFSADEATRKVPARYQGWRMTVYPLEWQAKAIEFLEGDCSTLYIYGAVGTRKTSFAAAVFRTAAFVCEGSRWLPDTFTWSGEFVPAYEAAERIRSLESKLIEPWKHTPFLVLDDIGANRSTPHVVEQLLFLIQYRYDNLMKTVITSNKDLAGLAEIIDPRAASRMQEGIVLNLGGTDTRGRGGGFRNGERR